MNDGTFFAGNTFERTAMLDNAYREHPKLTLILGRRDGRGESDAQTVATKDPTLRAPLLGGKSPFPAGGYRHTTPRCPQDEERRAGRGGSRGRKPASRSKDGQDRTGLIDAREDAAIGFTVGTAVQQAKAVLIDATDPCQQKGFWERRRWEA